MKTIFFAGAMTLTVMSMQAQSHKDRKHSDANVAFGIKGGVNISNLHFQNNNNVNTDSKVSFHAGGLAHIHVSKYFAVQPEIMYSNQGYKYDESNNTTTKARLHYINVPVLAQFMVGTGFRLETGPQLGILTAASQKSGKISVDIKDNLKPIDFSWAFGVGYVTPSGFGVDARYNVGISNINDVPNSGSINNRVFQAGVFYQFAAH